MIKFEDGIYNDIDIKDYHADREYFSSSGLKLAKRSLKLFKMFLDGEVDALGNRISERKPQFDFGNAFEIALLERDKFDDYVILFDESERPEPNMTFGSKKNKEWRDSIYQSEKYVIPKYGEKDSFEVLEKMLTSCYQDRVIQELINNIEYQSSIFWTDSETGLKLKTRPDITKRKKNVIVDVKTTINGSPIQFNRDAANFDYPFQAVMQIDGVLQSGYMDSVDVYYWLVVEKTPPYSATLYEFSPDDIAWVMDEYQYILGLVARSFQENKFPSYSQLASNKYGILKLNIPLYYKNNLNPEI